MNDDRMTYRGHELIYNARDDVWMAATGDLDSAVGTLPEVRKAIDQWEIARQIEGGFEVWSIANERPKHWSKRQAVFRKGYRRENPRFHLDPTHTVMTRNFQGDPDSLYGICRGNIAMDTPEVREAIEKARDAYDAALEAQERYREAKAQIPTMTEEEWLKLPKGVE